MATAERSINADDKGLGLAPLILRNPALTIAIIISATMLIGLVTNSAAKGTFATDFGVYWRTANDSPSAAYLPRSSLPFPYAPTMLIWIAPLAFVPLWLAFSMWVMASIGALWTVCRRYLTNAETGLVLLSPPLVNGLATGQVSAALAAILLWSMATSNRIAAGAALAVIASVKPQMIVLAPLMMLLQKDWRAILTSGVVLAGLMATSVAVFGYERWPEWIASMNNFRSVLHDHNVLGVAITPAAAAEKYGLPPLPFLIVGVGLGIWLVYRCRDLPPLSQCGAIACGSLLAAPYALTYDLAPVMPFLVWSIFRGSVTSALAIAGALNPLPLLFAVFNLVRSDRLKQRETERA